MPLHGLSSLNRFFTLTMILSGALSQSFAQTAGKDHPWSNSSLSPDERASMVVKEMTLEEKISLLHGTGMAGLSPMSPLAGQSNGGAGYVVGIPRLGMEFGAVARMDATRRRCPRTWPRPRAGISMPLTNTEL